jgi:hypothetical protein
MHDGVRTYAPVYVFTATLRQGLKAPFCGCCADSMRGWRTDKLRKFPELHFTYEEETSPEDFFVPYVWTFVVTHGGIPWHTQAIALFSPLSAAPSTASIDAADATAALARGTSNGSEIYASNGA